MQTHERLRANANASVPVDDDDAAAQTRSPTEQPGRLKDLRSQTHAPPLTPAMSPAGKPGRYSLYARACARERRPDPSPESIPLTMICQLQPWKVRRGAAKNAPECNAVVMLTAVESFPR